ncbi:MAG: hypothetical protein ACJ8LG_17355 [Massilia sp.]
MNETLIQIVLELNQVIGALNAHIPNDEPFGNVTNNNWTFPGLTKSELVEAADELVSSIREFGTEDLGPHEKQLASYVPRLSFLRTQTVPNMPGNPGAAVPTYFLTLDGLSKALAPVLKNLDGVTAESRHAAQRVLKRLRDLETRLDNAEPRSGKVSDMLERIEQAYEAADQLPADLQSLTEAREKIKALLTAAEADLGKIRQAELHADSTGRILTSKEKEATSVLEHCHSAYAAATSQGLAAAFAERSTKLAWSMWFWVVAFAVALGIGAWVGTQRIHEIGELFKNPAMTNWALGINLLLAALSVGGAIWFGWLATKQINQRFRLAEDYAFKASVSRAYEGYRREAARIDKDMEAKLLASALARLDEQPLRFVERENHGSPLHELAASEAVKSAIKSVPGFADKVIELACSSVSALSAPRAKDAGTPKLPSPDAAETSKTQG